MIKKLRASQIYDLMVERPGSAEGRDVAVASIDIIDETEIKILRDRITGAAKPLSPDHKDFKVSFVRGYLLNQLGKIAHNDIHSINLLLKHVVPEEEADHWVRFWAFSGCHNAKLNKTVQIAHWITNRYATVAPGEDFKSLLLAHAILNAKTSESGHDTLIRQALEGWLNAANIAERKAQMLPCQDALRVLGIVSVPQLTSLVTQVLETSGANPRTLFLACGALASIPEDYKPEAMEASRALVRFLAGAGNTRVLMGVREEALKALGKLKDPAAEFGLIKELQGGSLNLIKAAARALSNTLGIEVAVQRILAQAAKDENPYTRMNFSIALRWMSDDKEQVAEALDHHMSSGSLEEQEYARVLMAEMGGTSALDKLSARTKVVEDYKGMLLKEQGKFQVMFDKTMLEARQGFNIALSMDVIVFVLGIFLLVVSGGMAMFKEGSLDNWVGAGMGGVGVLGIVYSTLIANPRKKVFRSVNALMNFKIIFLAYLRQLNQTDQAFTRSILDDDPISMETLEEYFIIIRDSLDEAVNNMVILKAQELREKIEDYKNEVATKALDVKQRIGDVRAGIGTKNKEAELQEKISQVNREKSALQDSATQVAERPSEIAEDPDASPGNLSTTLEAPAEIAGPKPPPGMEAEVAPGPKPAAREVAPGPKPMARTSTVPTTFVDHLKLREGWRNNVYNDSVGKPTAGLGHLLSSSENARYKVGERVPDAVLNGWAQSDAKWAYEAGAAQAKEIGVSDKNFINDLGAVNFQLGAAWRKKFPGTWRLIAGNQYEQGAQEAANSNWFKQTPVRVMDFQRGLLNLAGKSSDYESVNTLNAVQIKKRGVKLPSKQNYDAGAPHGTTTVANTNSGTTSTSTVSPPPPKPPVSGTNVAASGVPEAVINHLKLREGWRTKVYLDSLGKPTVGLGHLLLPAQNEKYKVGDRIPDSILNNWAQQDTKKAYDAAESQAKQLGIGSQIFINALTSVNFQLGTRWYKIFKSTWANLLAGEYEKAATGIGTTKWARQTPVRVKDFQEALRALPAKNSASTTSTTTSTHSSSTGSSGSGKIQTSGVPAAVLEHLKLREGWRTKVYLDSLGKPTVGLGHLMLPAQSAEYRVGDRVPDNVLNGWATKDAKKAYDAAVSQAKELGIGSQSFVNALASVNFQLGTRWYTIHRNTWKFMQKKQYDQAAVEVGNSKWKRQTPVRVADFQEALRAL